MVQKMKVQVTIKVPAKARVEAKPIKIAVAASDTVAKAKEIALSGSIPVPFPDTELFLRGVGVLDERLSLLDCGVSQGCFLDLVVKATEDTLVDQLADLLRANNVQSMKLEELSSLYVLKHGASVSQALNMLGLDGCLRDFLATTMALSVVLNAAGCATLLSAAKVETAASSTEDENSDDHMDDVLDDESSDEESVDALPASEVKDSPMPAKTQWKTDFSVSCMQAMKQAMCPSQQFNTKAEAFVPTQHQVNGFAYEHQKTYTQYSSVHGHEYSKEHQKQQRFPQNSCIDLDMFSDMSSSESEDEIPRPHRPSVPVQLAALIGLPQKDEIPRPHRPAAPVQLAALIASAQKAVPQMSKDDSDSECDRLPPPWQKKESSKYPGRFFYFNTITKETSWKVPTELVVAQAVSAAVAALPAMPAWQPAVVSSLPSGLSPMAPPPGLTPPSPVSRAAVAEKKDELVELLMPEAEKGFRPPPGLCLPANSRFLTPEMIALQALLNDAI